MNLAIVTSSRFAEHTPPPGHAEQPARADVMTAVAERWRDLGAAWYEPEAARMDELARVHAAGYLAELQATAGSAHMLDPDTFTSPESWEIACLAAGAVVQAGRLVLAGPLTRAAALVRPPGHHALADRAMGFCLLNNVAVAAADLLAHGLSRVAIVDTDVHHGNGTQAIFEAHPGVLYVSLHQWPLYPGSGAAEEVGIGDGAGYTVNVPLPPWCVDPDYERACVELVVPVLRQFCPQVLLVSAGFDGHVRDPLARMRLTETGFQSMTRHLVGVADACCDGRIVLATEGGYDLPSLASSLTATLGAMAGVDVPFDCEDQPPAHPETTAEARAVVNHVRRVQSAFWRGL